MCQRGPVGHSGPSKCTGTRNPGQVPSMTLEGGQALAERGPRAGACACRRTCRQGSPHTASPSTERRSSPRAGSGAGVRCAATPRERRTRRRKRSVALPAAAMACAVSMAVGSESAQAVRGPRDGPAVCPATRKPLHEAIVAPARTNVGNKYTKFMWPDRADDGHASYQPRKAEGGRRFSRRTLPRLRPGPRTDVL